MGYLKGKVAGLLIIGALFCFSSGEPATALLGIGLGVIAGILLFAK